MKTFILVLAILFCSILVSAQETITDSLATSQSNKEVRIFPNPVKETLTMSDGTRYVILNLVAKPILDGYGRRINLTDLKEGHYFIQIYEGDILIATKKFIKE